MKYLLIVGDGMADYPIPELNHMTPLQVAKKPNINMIAAKGRNGLLKTIPNELIPGSGTAILSVLGYDPKIYYSGRGPFEAASRNINLDKNDIVYRCNLVTEKNGILIDYSANHIPNKDSKKLIATIKNHFKNLGEVEFFTGLGYRHFLVIRNYNHKEIVDCVPPHDAIGQKILDILPQAKNDETKKIADLLSFIIINSKKVLQDHPTNVSRKKSGKKPGNMLWPWGGGRKPVMPTIKEKYGVTSAVISAVDLVKGIGVNAGMKVVEVPGATGLYDTNYEGKAEHALQALEKHDLVFVHVEAPDEAGHSRDYDLKIKTIEDLDNRLLGRLLDGLKEKCVIAVLPDHPTPSAIGTHTRDPVPFTIYSPSIKGDKVKFFDEISAKKGIFGFVEGEGFILQFLGKNVTK
jgi:2,3-bisphosphoglycerate-independent phosphoglycerate mutase